MLSLAALVLFSSIPFAQAAIQLTGSSEASTVIGYGTPAINSNYQTKGENSSTSLTIAVPDFSSSNSDRYGQLLLAQIAIYGTAAINAPSGWNLLNSTTTSTTGKSITQAIFWKLHAGSSETQNHTWSWSGSVPAAGGITLYSGVSMGNPFDAWVRGTTNNTTDFHIPTLTTLSGSTMLVAFLASGQNGSNHTVPSGMGSNHNYDQNVQDDAKRLRVTGVVQSGVAANTTVTKTANHRSTSADNIAHLIALRPANADSANPSLTIARPTATANGDTMIASILVHPCATTNNAASCVLTITKPAGWTDVGQRDTPNDRDGGTDGYGSRLFVYRKLANNEPTSYTWEFDGVSSPRKIDAVGGIVSFSGVNPDNPIDVEASQSNQPTTASRTQSTPSVTTSVADTMLVATLGIHSSGDFQNPTSGLTAHANRASRSLTDARGLTLAMYSAAQATAGSTGSKQATLSSSSTADSGVGHLLALRPVSAGPHHLEIQHSSGNGVTCAATTLIVRACADEACSSLYTGGIAGTLSATGSPTVIWGGGNADFSIAAGSGSVTKGVQVTTPGSVVFGVSSTAPSVSNATTCNFGSPTCTFTAADAGFLLSVSNHAAESSETLSIQAVRKSDNSLACAPGVTGNKSVNFKCTYGNPSNGTLPVRVNGTPLAGNADSACSSGGASLTLNFNSSGEATATLVYADVGEMGLSATYTGSAVTEDTGLVLAGTTDFIAAPASFAISGITADPKAGADFSATVTVRNSAGTATPNFGKESSPVGITISKTLVAPVGGEDPALNNGTVAGSAFNNGVANLTNLSWDEAGAITLSAALASGTYLSSGVTTQAGVSGDLVFIPNHFDTIVVGNLDCPTPPSCPLTGNGAAYSGQPFTTTITARNAKGGVTKNYANNHGLSREVELTAWNAAGATTVANQNPGDGALANATVAASRFAEGVAAAVPSYALATAQSNPTNVYVRATETSLGSVTSLRGASSVEGGVTVLSGRIALANAVGPELLRLPVNFTVQYFNGSNWVISQTDNSSSFLRTEISLASCTRNLAVDGASPPANCKPVVGIATNPSTIGVVNGAGTFYLNPPGAGNNGSVLIDLAAPIYLPAQPARAQFGSTPSRLIYSREIF